MATMWIVGVVTVVVLVACVWALLVGGGEQGPFLALSKRWSDGRVTGARGSTDFQDDLRKPRDESELL